jgi:hypothetical protein
MPYLCPLVFKGQTGALDRGSGERSLAVFWCEGVLGQFADIPFLTNFDQIPKTRSRTILTCSTSF